MSVESMATHCPGKRSGFVVVVSAFPLVLLSLPLLFSVSTTLAWSFIPVHDSAASAPLRSVNTNGAAASAPRTKRRRLFSVIEVSPGMAVSPVEDDKSGEFPAPSSDSVVFIDSTPKNIRARCRRFIFSRLASPWSTSGSLSSPATPSPRTKPSQNQVRPLLEYPNFRARGASLQSIKSRFCKKNRKTTLLSTDISRTNSTSPMNKQYLYQNS